MLEDRSIDFIDIIIFILKQKKFYFLLATTVFILSYLAVYFFVPPVYETNALILPSTQIESTSFGSTLKNLTDLTGGLASMKKGAASELYRTIIFSRTFFDSLIVKFDLQHEYRIKERDDVYAELMRRIGADETKDNAFAIKVESSSPQKAAEMAKYMIYLLNKTAVFLNTQKQHDNALFLEKRYMKIKADLANAEDSLRMFQKSSGYFEASEQLKSTIDVYARMEADVASKEIEAKLMEKMYGASSPQGQRAFDAYNEYNKKLQSIKSGKEGSSILVGVNGIPEKSIRYLRLYRDIKINSTMLEYIIPIYEQVKFEEQKQTPVIQVVDTPSMPEKRSGPKRMLTALIITICTVFFTFLFMFTKHRLAITENPKIILLRENLKVLKRKK